MVVAIKTLFYKHVTVSSIEGNKGIEVKWSSLALTLGRCHYHPCLTTGSMPCTTTVQTAHNNAV